MHKLDETYPFQPLRFAVLAISDSRDLATDKSGATLQGMIEATGHKLADRTIVNDDLPAVSVADVAIDESAGTAIFTVTMSEAHLESVHVDFATADGTALAGSDYASTAGTLTFAAGETTKTGPTARGHLETGHARSYRLAGEQASRLHDGHTLDGTSTPLTEQAKLAGPQVSQWQLPHPVAAVRQRRGT